MYLTFVDPKHAFDTVLISAHWRIMKKHIIEAAVSSVIDVLSDNEEAHHRSIMKKYSVKRH